MSLFHVATRLQARAQLRDHGFGWIEINRHMRNCTDEMIGQAASAVGGQPNFSATEGVAALGDGEILKKIIEFLQSDTGQMLIQILLSLLLAL